MREVLLLKGKRRRPWRGSVRGVLWERGLICTGGGGVRLEGAGTVLSPPACVAGLQGRLSHFVLLSQCIQPNVMHTSHFHILKKYMFY